MVAQSSNRQIVTIDARHVEMRAPGAPLRMGGTSPAGHAVAIGENRYLTFDGAPWLPVMGEFHYSRYPEQDWEEELLKMKAGGVQIVATYVFWIHHEEVEGQFDWSGRRNLRAFLNLCEKHGLYVFLRIGPYAHGEVRNGGFPDWVVARGKTRQNDPAYLALVRTYFAQIGAQIKGLEWKDNGPILGIQLENEYHERGPGKGAEHIAELKKIAQESGIEAPFYTVTGWENPDFPPGEVLPVFGIYPDDFWSSTLEDHPPSEAYLFEKRGAEQDLAGKTKTEQRGETQYPFLLAEAGGGMQVAYHRRPVIHPDDVAALTLTYLGSGANLYGYYLFQGGANPDGRRTSLQESVETDHVYDLPKVSYDFQAPLGQYGQMRPSFRALKPLHYFLNEFGADLALTIPVLPATLPANASDRNTLRVAARVAGDHAFIFVNNYARNFPLPDHPGVQIQLALPSETIMIPREPVTITAGSYFLWPVNLELDGTLLKFATAQPLTRIDAPGARYYFFFAQPGIAPEFVFDAARLESIDASPAEIVHAEGAVYVRGVRPGSGIAFTLHPTGGQVAHVVVLTQEQALDFWKLRIGGQDYGVLSPADVFADDSTLHLLARDIREFRFSVFPPLSKAPRADVPVQPSGTEGVFSRYFARVPVKDVALRWKLTRKAGPSKPVKKGKYNAEAPTDQEFGRAGVWQIQLSPKALQGLHEVFLRVNYAGDVARLYAGSHLLDDDFFHGGTWEIGLKRFAPELARSGLDLKILPLRSDAPIYLPRDARPKFPPNGEVVDVLQMTARPEYEVRIRLGAGAFSGKD